MGTVGGGSTIIILLEVKVQAPTAGRGVVRGPSGAVWGDQGSGMGTAPRRERPRSRRTGKNAGGSVVVVVRRPAAQSEDQALPCVGLEIWSR